MNNLETNIEIFRRGNKIEAISVLMPIWNKLSDHGNLIINLPLLGIETIAKDENDADKAIEEAIISFCIVAEKFGQGIEKELISLGWSFEEKSNSLVYVSENNSVVEQILKTGDNYIKSHLEIAA